MYADETKSSDSETAASETVPETQASPVILPTDKVSTDDIILYSSAACVIDVDSGEIIVDGEKEKSGLSYRGDYLLRISMNSSPVMVSFS